MAPSNELTKTQYHVTATQALAREVAAGKEPAPDIVIWPENSTDLSPFEYQFIYDEIQTAKSRIAAEVEGARGDLDRSGDQLAEEIARAVFERRPLQPRPAAGGAQ